MSVEKPDNLEPAPPRETGVLYGHGEAEQALLGAYRSSRFPHAWLIAGPAGIAPDALRNLAGAGIKPQHAVGHSTEAVAPVLAIRRRRLRRRSREVRK